MTPPPPTPLDVADMIERCRVNLVSYQDAIEHGQLCACVARQGDYLVAVTTDGDSFVGAVEQVVEFLARQDVTNQRLTLPDWREGDIAPTASEQIAIRSMLRRLQPGFDAP